MLFPPEIKIPQIGIFCVLIDTKNLKIECKGLKFEAYKNSINYIHLFKLDKCFVCSIFQSLGDRESS